MCRRTTRSCLPDLVFSKNHVPPWIPLIVGFGPPQLPFLCCYCRHHEKFFFPVSISFFSFRTAGLDCKAVSRSKRLCGGYLTHVVHMYRYSSLQCQNFSYILEKKLPILSPRGSTTRKLLKSSRHK